MTIITKAITEKKAADIVELPLVVNETQSENLKDDLEGQQENPARTTHYVLRCRQRAKRLYSLTTLCLFLTALLVMSIGVIGGVYIYKQYARVQMHRFRGWCDIPYYDSNKAPYLKDALENRQSLIAEQQDVVEQDEAAIIAEKAMEIENMNNFFKEEFEIDLEHEEYEKIDVPDLRGGRQGRYIHDFYTNKTSIIDIEGHRCFVMPLNRERVLQPRNLYDLVHKIWRGDYEVDTQVIRETMKVITPPITDLSSLGPYISNECRDLPTYRLEKVVRSVEKRSVQNTAPFVQYSGKNILELDIENIEEIQAYEKNLLSGIVESVK